MNDESTILLLQLAIPAGLLLLWWVIGSRREKRHLASLARREAGLSGLLLTTLRAPVGAAPDAPPPALVAGEAAIASDGFKTWVFRLRNLFGGESKSFARLYDRARREALLRLADDARARGFDAVCCIRFSAVDIGGNATSAGGRKNAMNMAVCIATGTAYRRAPAP
ncbi:MAG: heavy metal-binding domain-containing protein [Kiritimatiellae bacterium]|nr:heavy metal-binding domain-containing protein [Kiritimatiellia bacterium]